MRTKGRAGARKGRVTFALIYPGDQCLDPVRHEDVQSIDRLDLEDLLLLCVGRLGLRPLGLEEEAGVSLMEYGVIRKSRLTGTEPATVRRAEQAAVEPDHEVTVNPQEVQAAALDVVLGELRRPG
jgi:hypothetical protein